MELSEYVVRFTSLLKHACEFAKEGVPSGTAGFEDYKDSIRFYSKKWKDFNDTSNLIQKKDTWEYDEKYALKTLKAFRREVKVQYHSAGILLRESVKMYGEENLIIIVPITIFAFLAGRRHIVSKYLWECRRLNQQRQEKGKLPLTPVEMLTMIDAKHHTFSDEFWAYTTDNIARYLLPTGRSKSPPAPTILGGFLHDLLSRPDVRLAKVLSQESHSRQGDTYSLLAEELVSLTPVLISESFYTLQSRAREEILNDQRLGDRVSPNFNERFVREEQDRATDPYKAVEEKSVFEQLSQYVPKTGRKREYYNLICQHPHLAEHGGTAEAARLLGLTENNVRQIRLQLFQVIRQNSSLENN